MFLIFFFLLCLFLQCLIRTIACSGSQKKQTCGFFPSDNILAFYIVSRLLYSLSLPLVLGDNQSHLLR
jgi:hypothetical protein